MERLKPKVSIISSIGLALLAICNIGKEPKIKIIKPKEIEWQQRRSMRRIPKSGKK